MDYYKIDINGYSMSYTDVGKGEVIVFVHGTPASSFLYRKFIQHFSKTNRCIAMDHVGFGLSQKSDKFEGTPQNHAANFNMFIEKLGIQNFTLVVHDFGGPIALPYAMKYPSNIKRIVLFNTWIWETKSNKTLQKADKLISSPIGKFLYKRLNFPLTTLLNQAFYNKTALSKEVKAGFKNPFKKIKSRKALYDIALSLTASSDWYEQHWQHKQALSDTKMQFIWGTKDPFFGLDYLDKWLGAFPTANYHKIEAGHFVQEEQPKESIKIMEEFFQTST